MKIKGKLIKNIVIAFSMLFITHSAFYSLAAYIYKISRVVSIIYYSSSFLFHALICIMLILLNKQFVLEKNGKPLDYINISNFLTLIRITALPVIFIFTLNIETYPLLPFFIPYISTVFITDFLDGITARRLNQVTVIGKFLDSISDYLVLGSISIIFYIFGFIPLWFFILILARMGAYPAFLLVLSIMKKKLVHSISFLGKVSIFLTMFLFAFELLIKFKTAYLSPVRIYVEIVIGIIVLVSLVEKMVKVMKDLKAVTDNKEIHST